MELPWPWGSLLMSIGIYTLNKFDICTMKINNCQIIYFIDKCKISNMAKIVVYFPLLLSVGA